MLLTPLTKNRKDKLDSSGDSNLFEDSVDVVPDGMFLNLESLCDFAVFQSVGDEANDIFFAASQKGHSLVVLHAKRPNMG
jgi:hypothetical protein